MPQDPTAKLQAKFKAFQLTLAQNKKDWAIFEKKRKDFMDYFMVNITVSDNYDESLGKFFESDMSIPEVAKLIRAANSMPLSKWAEWLNKSYSFTKIGDFKAVLGDYKHIRDSLGLQGSDVRVIMKKVFKVNNGLILVLL